MSTSRTREKADGELFKSTGIDDNATSTAVTIDASENVMVGKSATAFGTAGIELNQNGVAGKTWLTRSGGEPLTLNRLSSDGHLVAFYKDGGTSVGSIGAKSGAVYIGTGDAGIAFNHHGGGDLDSMMPYSVTAGAFQNGAVDIGGSVNRFKDLYLSGGVYLGGTGAANKLQDYETGSWTPVITGITSTSEIKSGWYWKIGTQVIVQCVIALPSATKTASNVSVSGFPFSATKTVLGSYHFVNNYTNHGSDPQTNGSFNKFSAHNYTTSMQKYDGTQLIGSDVAGASPELYIYLVYPD